MAAVGYLAGYQFREWRANMNAQETAVIKHYIMTHPEEFPEPEKKLFRDKEVFYPIHMAR